MTNGVDKLDGRLENRHEFRISIHGNCVSYRLFLPSAPVKGSGTTELGVDYQKVKHNAKGITVCNHK